jgi:preprotein translocase subunit SecB
MSELDPTQGNGAAPTGPAFTVEKLYIKDVSFEAPGTPQVFNEAGQPQLQMNLNQRVQRLGDTAFEVVLGVTLTCTIDDKTAYLAEVQQAGVFGLVGFDEMTLDAMLGTHCPNALYPYARQAISDLIQGGGFPPFLLQPINFEALYAEGVRQRAEQSPDDGLASAETAGNA